MMYWLFKFCKSCFYGCVDSRTIQSMGKIVINQSHKKVDFSISKKASKEKWVWSWNWKDSSIGTCSC
jgi:hypothetical protein